MEVSFRAPHLDHPPSQTGAAGGRRRGLQHWMDHLPAAAGMSPDQIRAASCRRRAIGGGAADRFRELAATRPCTIEQSYAARRFMVRKPGDRRAHPPRTQHARSAHRRVIASNGIARREL